MRFDSATLVANTIVSGSFEITGTTVPGDSSSYDLGTASKLWRTVYSSALSGSLTKLSTGGDYLVAGTGINLSTGSSGAVTITATVAGSSLIGGSNTQVQFNDNNSFGGSSLLTYNKNTGALTGTYIISSTGFSGSLTKLSTGADYLVAGTGISLTTGSSGDVTIASTAITSPGGLDTQVQFRDGSTFGGNSGLTYNKTSQALTGTYIVASTGFSGSLTKLSSGGDYLLAAGNVVLTTGSNGSISISTVNSGTIHGVTAGTGLIGGGSTGTVSLSLSNTGSAGTYGSSSSVPVLTTDDQGRVTSVSPTSIQVTQGQVTNLTSDLSGKVSTSTTITAGSGLSGGGDLSASRTLSIDDTKVATISGSTFSGVVKFNSGLSGSLTKLESGSDYLIAGTGIVLSTGSSGAVTITSAVAGSSLIGGSDTQVQFNDGSSFGGNSGLTYNKTTQALTGTYVVASTGFSGSLTKLSSGSDYLVAGTGIQLTTGSSGNITIASTVAGSSFVSGFNTQVQFNDGGSFGSSNLLTFNKTTGALTSSVIVATQGLTGSLTKLTNGDNYLVGGPNVTITTGSSGQVTISSTTNGASVIAGSNTQIQFNDGGNFGANSGLTYNKTTQALTGTYVIASTGFSGSLTKLSTGSDYLVAGTGIQLTTGSSGNITIASTVAGSSLVAGSNTQVQFNNGGTFGADSNFTFNSTTDTLSVTNISGSLTRLTSGDPYLVGGSGIVVTTGSNGSVTMSLGAVNYATASFTNATNITVNHSVGTTIYDIEVFDTSYNKIIPGIATATSPTQANLTFAIPTSGFVAVGGPTAGGSGASANTLLVTGSSYLVTDVTIPAQGASSSATVTLITFTIPAAGTWDVTYFTNPVSFTTQGYAAGEFALYDSLGNRIADSAVLSIYNPSNIYSAAQNSGRIFLATTGSTSYTLRYTSFSYSQAITVRASTFGRTGVIWSSMGGSTGVTGFGATNFLPLFNTSTALTASNIQVSGTDVNFLTSSIAITNGYGIRLPASGSNTNANTLDCYEEGQATSGMTYTGITVTGGSVVCTATWTKFGRGMFLHVTIGPQSGQAITFASSWQINLSAVTGYPNFYTANSPISVAAVWVGGNVDQANAWYSGTNRIIYGTNAAMGNSAWTNVGYTMSCFIPF